MNLLLDYYSISLLVGAFATFLAGIVIFIHRPDLLENRAWFLLNISSSAWSMGYFMLVTSSSHDQAFFWNSFLHYAAIILPLFYFLFVLAITKTVDIHRTKLIALSIVSLFFLVMNETPYFVRDVLPKHTFSYAPDAGPLYIYFALYFFAIVLYSLWIIFLKFRTAPDAVTRNRLWSIIIFTIFGFGGGGSVFLITFNVGIPPYPLALFALYPIVSGYAVFRYQLFEVKVLTTEILTFSLWLFLASKLVLSEGKERYTSGGLLVVMIILGILLIRSVMREVENRERIQTLAQDLEKANGRLKELDQLKTEFLSIATHQMRAPITAIKGYASLILENNYGPISDELKKAASAIFQSGQNMALMVDDFLNISRIEQGRMKYDFAVIDLCSLLQQSVTELKPSAEKKSLQLTMTCDAQNGQEYRVRVDSGKIKQVFTNLIDNAIKYTPKGSIAITVTSQAPTKKVLVRIKDTGVGIPTKAIGHLFEKFSRAQNAITTNVSGTGLGLYVAKQMIAAHNGRVWAESEGEGKGSTFCVELDLV